MFVWERVGEKEMRALSHPNTIVSFGEFAPIQSTSTFPLAHKQD